ncbi:MAG: Uma2 family endonuclease [Candidatus Latescibacteria bacterium]|nr:Uma2 family endonuclease [Candidatus Latescibacterota bacterium]
MPKTFTPSPTDLTYEDFLTLPDDGKRYEILDGELHVTPSPLTTHQRAVMNLGALLHHHVRRNGLGEVFLAPPDVILAETTIVEPDLLFIARQRAKIITRANIRGAPDLIVEVLSRRTARVDRGRKKKLYARYGVQHYWLVDPDTRSVEVYALENGKYRLIGHYTEHTSFEPSLFPGLTISLDEVWD